MTNPNDEREELDKDDKVLKGNLSFNGTYYLEVVCRSFLCDIGSRFKSIIPEIIMDTIDLTKEFYFYDFRFSTWRENYGVIKYKVINQNDDKYMYLAIVENDYFDGNYVPYYSDDSFNYTEEKIFYTNLTIFEVFDVGNNKTEENVKVFNFKKNEEYIITVHCLKHHSYWYNIYFYPRYAFIPFSIPNIKRISGEEGIINLKGPMLGIINFENKNNLYLYLDQSEKTILLYTKTDDSIESNINILSDLEYKEGFLQINREESQNVIILILPLDFNVELKLFLVDEIEEQCKSSYLVPANTAKLIICDDKEEKEILPYFNFVSTYKSEYKNMRITFSFENEGTDYIIQNYLSLPIYVEKTNKESTITLTKYPPKFAFFGAENPYIFKTFYQFLRRMYYSQEGIDINSVFKFPQMYFRINSKYLPWFEFYNFYLNQLDLKFNFYIKQLYGGSDVYECSTEGIDPKNLQFLTTPISNLKCKNKKSIFNRLFSLDGTKILSGYLTPDSYFDIYIEVKDDTSNSINLSSVMEEFRTTNTAKYLKKDVEYKINFALNHLIKLEPAFNAEIKITNGQTSSTINTKNPTVDISGEGFTIKSNNDAMVYFFGKISEMPQMEIEIEKSKGKIVKIENFSTKMIIDIGFEGTYPSAIPWKENVRDNGILYLDNVYEKMKGNLVNGEKLFIYSYSKNMDDVKINYIEKSINNKNNDFNIFLIPDNGEENTLIVNTDELREIIMDIRFCEDDTVFKLSLLRENETDYIFTNNNFTERNMSLIKGDNKMSFKTTKPAVFTYSFYDIIDEDTFQNNENYWNVRKILNELKIDEIADKNNKGNVMKIKFKPNYKQSSTRYIIIVAQKNSENTLYNFKNPCFITGLLNQRPKGVKVDTIYDVGEDDSIEAEVDISDILNENNNYIMNIISQELRFDKKINFYEPNEFYHENQNGEDEDNGGLKGTALVLTIVFSIIGFLIIAFVVIFICRRKKPSSEEIEKLTILTS